TARLTITSPQHGDHYQIPPGVEGRYATIALRAAGAPAGAPVRWMLDGHPVTAGRWTLVPGRHRVRAISGGMTDEVEITVSAAGQAPRRDAT
ncbi:MAG TPA: hypothetical protein PKA50_05210, partial [Gemmatimonadales bacterium]|nr:hypothetical protein [Gemmatimonadales bacterium]